MKAKTSELSGAALDWAVAKCEAERLTVPYGGKSFLDGVVVHPDYNKFYPSTDWSQGGPIIEREHISIEATRIGGLGDRWMATSGDCAEFEDKPLIAAMRCYVASKLGDEVEIPEELK